MLLRLGLWRDTVKLRSSFAITKGSMNDKREVLVQGSVNDCVGGEACSGA